MGLIVSTLSTVATPMRSLRGSQTNCGEWRKTGSTTFAASRMWSREIEASTVAELRAWYEPAPPALPLRRCPPGASRHPPLNGGEQLLDGMGGGNWLVNGGGEGRPGGGQGGALLGST